MPLLIIGGGIAGLTLARSLQIANIPYYLFEKTDKFYINEKAGTGIGLWGPAERIMNSLGLGDKIRNVSQRMTCAGYRTQQGDWLAKPPALSGKDITSCLTLLRGDLISTLLDSLPQNKIFNNHEFSHFETTNEGIVKAFFKNGQKYEGSFLVAADGINSMVRKQIYPDIKSIYCGYSYYRAVMDLKSTPNTLFPLNWHDSKPEIAWESWGKDCRIAYVPLKGSKIFWFVSKTMSEEDSNAEFHNVLKLQENQILANEIAKNGVNWHNPISQIISATPNDSIIFTPIRKIKMKPSKWVDVEKRVVIIGDAAHAIPPNLASGGMISMEDAVQLASSLRPLFNNYSTEKALKQETLKPILEEYVKKRKTKVRIIQISNAMIAKYGQLHYSFLIKARDKAINMIPMSLRTMVFNSLHRFYLGWNYTTPNLGQGLYHRLFVGDPSTLNIPELLNKFHQQKTNYDTSHKCEGEVTVKAGSSFVSKFIVWASSMPPSIRRANVKAQIIQKADGSEIWIRNFIDSQTGKEYIFETTQYIENEDFVEVVNPFNLNILHIEVLMNLVKHKPPIEGFSHDFKGVRIRLFPFIKGGLKIGLFKFLQPIVHGNTKLSPDGKSWELDVGISAPNNLFWRILNGKNKEIAGYIGKITKFNKPSIVEWNKTEIKTQNASSLLIIPPKNDYNVLLLGGFGLFGSRIASGLIIQAISQGIASPNVILTSRNRYDKQYEEIKLRILQKLNQNSNDNPILGSDIQKLLRQSNFNAQNFEILEKQIKSQKINTVINCIGPFQKADYAIPSLCAKLGVNYIDLADARVYVSSFADQLDKIAKANGVHLITGASSVPGLSSCILKFLVEKSKITRIDKVNIAISPGNKTQRGIATIESILGQVGKPIPWAWHNKKTFGWQELKLSKKGQFHPKIRNRRWLSAIDVPDMAIMPQYLSELTNDPKLPKVEFKAGLENSFMHLGLYSASWLVRAGLIQDMSPYSKILKNLSETRVLYDWMGSDRGGMFVELEGWSESRKENLRTIWRLYGGSGEGVQIPATPAIVLTLKLIGKNDKNMCLMKGSEDLKIGAHPCLGLFTREEFMKQFELYDIEDDIIQEKILG